MPYWTGPGKRRGGGVRRGGQIFAIISVSYRYGAVLQAGSGAYNGCGVRVNGKNHFGRAPGADGEAGGPDKRAQRESREAAALRDNLRRRKGGGQPKSEATGPPGPERPRHGPGRTR